MTRLGQLIALQRQALEARGDGFGQPRGRPKVLFVDSVEVPEGTTYWHGYLLHSTTIYLSLISIWIMLDYYS